MPALTSMLRIAAGAALAAVLVLAAAPAAFADDGNRQRARAIDSLQDAERRAIEQGRYSGQLTRREYRELSAEQARIDELERTARADGYISKREFRDIRSAQGEAARNIESESSDRNVSLWRKWLYRVR